MTSPLHLKDGQEVGASPASQDRVTDASHGASKLSPPSGSVPTDADEYPHLVGCLKSVASFLATYGILAVIAVAVGYEAAFWFGLGALLTGVLALYEAGKSALEADAPTPSDPNTPNTGRIA